jgi:sulfonate transport system substrate-binding protein
MDIPKSRAALLAGRVDAALLAGSTTIKTVEAGGHIVVTAKGLISPTLVTVARGAFLRDHPGAVETYVRTNAEALDWIRANLDEALAIGAEEQGISVADARKLWDWTEFVTKLTEGDLKTMADDVGFMVDNGMMQKRLDPRDFVAGSALAK